VYLDFKDAIHRLGQARIAERYGNLFEMYQKITNEDPYSVPMRMYPAPHYAMGGLWVDYNLMSNLPGLFVIGEANFSDHGANRLGASALMQGLADGYFVLPYTIGGYLAQLGWEKVSSDTPEFKKSVGDVQEQTKQFLSRQGAKSPDDFHMELGRLMLDKCGMARNARGLQEALKRIPELREEFKTNLRVTGTDGGMNQTLEKAGRVSDFIDFAELMCRDALMREESCGGHFREEHQTPEGEALRDDEKFSFVSAWQYGGVDREPTLHKEELAFEVVKPSARSYK